MFSLICTQASANMRAGNLFNVERARFKEWVAARGTPREGAAQQAFELAEAAADVLAVHARVQRGVPDRGLRGVHPVHEAVRGLGFMRDGSGADVGLPRNRRR